MQQENDLLWCSTRGGSMFPFIREDDFILVKRVPPDTIMPGDTILYESENKNICHTVAKVETINGELWFYSKGYKSTSFSADPISQSNILGKVIALKRKNKVIDFTADVKPSFYFLFDCFLAERIFYLRNVLVKIPGLRKIYRYAAKLLGQN